MCLFIVNKEKEKGNQKKYKIKKNRKRKMLVSKHTITNWEICLKIAGKWKE